MIYKTPQNIRIHLEQCTQKTVKSFITNGGNHALFSNSSFRSQLSYKEDGNFNWLRELCDIRRL